IIVFIIRFLLQSPAFHNPGHMHGHNGLSFGFVANATFTPAFKEGTTLFSFLRAISALVLVWFCLIKTPSEVEVVYTHQEMSMNICTFLFLLTNLGSLKVGNFLQELLFAECLNHICNWVLDFGNPMLTWSSFLRACPEISASRASKTMLHVRCKAGEVSFGTSHRELMFKMKRFYRRGIPESKSSYGVNGKDDGDMTMRTLVWRAIKLPIYSVALIPLTVGAAAAYLQTGIFSAKRYFTLLISSVLIITWLNLRTAGTSMFLPCQLSRKDLESFHHDPSDSFDYSLMASNDVYDFDTGADKNKKESVVNLVGSRSGAFIAAYFCLIAGFTGLTWTCVGSRSIRANLLLTWAIICGYIYQCPPFRLSYHGLGEPLCFAAFGPFATTAFYLLLQTTSGAHKFQLTMTVLSASFLIGFTTTLILFCSHFHQIEEDEAVGKISPLVRLGTKRGSVIVRGAVVTLYSLLAAFGTSGALPFTCIVLSALTLPMGIKVVRFVEENHMNKGRIFMAKYYCVRLHALFGVALTAGLVLAKTFSKGYVTRQILLS
ncbi:2-carboxy-1,4-naphthoquinone phytyltransferase, chloroplastic, partial [Linum perenne]